MKELFIQKQPQLKLKVRAQKVRASMLQRWGLLDIPQRRLVNMFRHWQNQQQAKARIRL